MLAAIPTMAEHDLMQLASLEMPLPSGGMRTIDWRVRWEARRLLHARGKWPVLEPRPPGHMFEGMAMADGELPDGRIGSDGVPNALSKPEFVQLLEAGKPLPQPLWPEVPSKFWGGLQRLVDKESGTVIVSLGGDQQEDDD
jgi:hypothetical protein